MKTMRSGAYSVQIDEREGMGLQYKGGRSECE